MFEGQLDIIKSGIVNKEYNAFWDDVNTLVNGFTPKDVLVCTTAYDAGSQEDILLQKMLQACTLTFEQYNTLTITANQLVPWHGLHATLKPKYVLLFGVMPAQLGINAMFRLNEPNRFNDCLFVPTLALTDIEQQAEAKKQLWLSGLKPIFIDKTFQIPA